MTLPYTNQSAKSSLLHRALQGNGIFSSLSGAVFLIGARPLAAFLGLRMPIILTLLGLGLLIYGGFLWTAARTPISRRVAIAATILDLAWVLGSALLLLTTWVPFSPAGKWAVAVAADIVAVFAALQFYALRRTRVSSR